LDREDVGVEQQQRVAIASRVRCLIGGQAPTSIEEAAARLRVSEDALRATLESRQATGGLDVLVAIVRELGVDPHWLATGVYDGGTHRLALTEPDAVEDLLESAFAGEEDHGGRRFSYHPADTRSGPPDAEERA
jgi:hypothetical protein